MSRSAELKSLRPFWLPWIVLASALMLTAVIASQLSRNVELRARREFDATALEIQSELRARMNAYTAMLRGGAGLFAVNRWVDAAEFKTYVERLRVEELYPGIQGIGFAVRVTPENRDEIVSRLKRQGRGDLKIWPADDVPDAYPIIYLEPADERNRAAIGYDMFSEPIRRAAMSRARDEGEAAASGRVTLVQEIRGPKQPGFLIYLPVYASGAVPGTEEERRRSIEGFVYSPFRAHDLIEAILGERLPAGVHLEVFDGPHPRPEQLLFASGGAEGPLETIAPLEIAGRTWTLRFRGGPELLADNWRILAPVSASGVVIAFVLFSLTYTEARTRQRLQESEARLRASEELHRTVTETASDGVVSMDEESVILSANAAMERIFGYQPGELAGISLLKLMPERYRAPHRAGLKRFIETGERRIPWCGVEFPGLRKDGTEVPRDFLRILRARREALLHRDCARHQRTP